VNTASAGAAAGVIIYFLSYLPFSFFGSNRRYPEVPAKAKFGISLVPNLAMGIGCKTLAQFESTGELNYLKPTHSYQFTAERHKNGDKKIKTLERKKLQR